MAGEVWGRIAWISLTCLQIFANCFSYIELFMHHLTHASLYYVITSSFTHTEKLNLSKSNINASMWLVMNDGIVSVIKQYLLFSRMWSELKAWCCDVVSHVTCRGIICISIMNMTHMKLENVALLNVRCVRFGTQWSVCTARQHHAVKRQLKDLKSGEEQETFLN